MAYTSYLYFPGCKVQPFVPEYDRSVRALLSALDVEAAETELNCCGYPVRDIDFTASMLSATRVLAMAAQRKAAVLTPCKCCFGNLKQADFWMRTNAQLRLRINQLLKAEGLTWTGTVEVRHLLSVLAEDIGLARIRERVIRPLNELKVAAHYGCHALRPSDVTGFDNPLAPSIFENVIAACGALPVSWPLRLECCGYPLWGGNNRISLDLMHRKIKDAYAAGAQILATACTYCQIQFDTVRKQNPESGREAPEMPAILVSQLVGFACGLDPESLGLEKGHENFDF